MLNQDPKIENMEPKNYSYYELMVSKAGESYLINVHDGEALPPDTFDELPPVMKERLQLNPERLLLRLSDKGMRRIVDRSEAMNTPLQEQRIVSQPKQETRPMDETVAFIHNSTTIKPNSLFISELKWKFLVRSVMRAKNLMIIGPSGSGKTKAAKCVAETLNRPFFYFNLGATQDARSTLIGNTHYGKDTGTFFNESVFVKAIQTPDAVILLDEVSRAHPDAWNILMTVLDEEQRYLRLDEHRDTTTINVASGVSFIGTANIGNEYTATRVMDRALMDRFGLLEMDELDKDGMLQLIAIMYPQVPHAELYMIADVIAMIRAEYNSDASKLTSSISTRICVEMAGLAADGFNITEIAEICIYPFFDDAGGIDSERTFIKQIIQKVNPSPGFNDDLF
jgi:nitric oxide reductase NorQ protein